jgi:hypothetical protein
MQLRLDLEWRIRRSNGIRRSNRIRGSSGYCEFQ